jgi:ABC-2 type transport system ATP-binding protein
VLQNVSFALREGEITVLLGPNGAGKTTLMRTIMGLLSPDSGSVSVQGIDPATTAGRARQAIGYLPESGGVYGRMTATDYLVFFGMAFGFSKGESRERAANLLRRFGLEDRAWSKTAGFSKGMRQRLALARTLIHEPAILLLDEPTSSLDPEHAVEVRHLISGLRESRRSVLISTHNLDEAERLADRVLILAAGRLILQANRSELHAANGVTLVSIETSPEATAGLADVPLSGAHVLYTTGNVVELAVPGGRSAIPALVADLAVRGIPVYRVGERRQPLESVYLKAVEGSQGRPEPGSQLGRNHED